MKQFKKGDLIAKKHCATKDPLQIGIVLRDNEESFDIQWIWYNKIFFMEKEEDIFKELNNRHLLSMVRYRRAETNPLLCHMSDSYFNGTQINIASSDQETH
tara:strand:- start:325 stop:627 length:303 start_codon:yes stop_codon:yes gene_type:complete